MVRQHGRDRPGPAATPGLIDAPTRCTVVVLYGGAGGDALGWKQAGFQLLAIVEANPHAANTLRANLTAGHLEGEIIEARVEQTDLSRFRGATLLAGGPPCQPFSRGGKHTGPFDPRDGFPHALRAVRQVEPRYLWLENARDLLLDKFSGYRKRLELELRQLGYEARWHAEDAREHGVPQGRRRTLLVAHRRDAPEVTPPPPVPDDERPALWEQLRHDGRLHSLTAAPERLRKPVPSAHRPAWLKKHPPSQPFHDQSDAHTVLARHGAGSVNLIEVPVYEPGGPVLVDTRESHGERTALARLTGRWVDPPELMTDAPDDDEGFEAWLVAIASSPDIEQGLLEGEIVEVDDQRVRVRLADDELGTLDYPREVVFPDDRELRRAPISVLASIQGFPPDYVFTGGLNARGRQVGNAVPPPMARRWGEQILTADCAQGPAQPVDWALSRTLARIARDTKQPAPTPDELAEQQRFDEARARRLDQEHPAAPPGARPVVLVACGKSKRDEPVPARDLYTGSLFRAAAADAQRRLDSGEIAAWWVVSARHGLVAPDIVLEPYDQQLSRMPKAGREHWAQRVVTALKQATPLRGRTVELHMGRVYAEFLAPELRRHHARVEEPLAGQQVGQRLATYKARRLAAARAASAPSQPAAARLVDEYNAQGAPQPGERGYRAPLGTVAYDAPAVARRLLETIGTFWGEPETRWAWDAALSADAHDDAGLASQHTDEPLHELLGVPTLRVDGAQLSELDQIRIALDAARLWMETQPEHWRGEALTAGDPSRGGTRAPRPGLLLPTWAAVAVISDHLTNPRTRTRLVSLHPDAAAAFIARHHSALPQMNRRGLLYALGLQRGDRLAAVATAGTPTGRWKHPHCILEITRVASDGSLKGAASRLVARLIDLLPRSLRAPDCEAARVITYSLVSEDGATYRALRDKGLRPTGLVPGRKPAGARAGSTAGLAQVAKVRWEAGPGASRADWGLLDDVRAAGAVARRVVRGQLDALQRRPPPGTQPQDVVGFANRMGTAVEVALTGELLGPRWRKHLPSAA